MSSTKGFQGEGLTGGRRQRVRIGVVQDELRKQWGGKRGLRERGDAVDHSLGVWAYYP